ncbi:hypothetical protein HYY74_07225 [Candidatus Woesearchaeota archaeon]|nr:hypothetical protein [Candidatus Woesearchaeota archaeon]
MASFEGVIGASAVLIGGIGIFWNGFYKFYKKRLIENTPTSKIRSIAMGMVEINGKAVPPQGKVLTGLLSGDKCVYYRYAVEERKTDSKGRQYWTAIDRGEKRAHFYVKDETGTVLLDPTGAEVDIPVDFTHTLSEGRKTPATIVQYMVSKKINPKQFFFGYRPLRFTEWHIAPGDNLYVLGTAGSNPFKTKAVRNEEGAMIAKGKGTFVISDSSEKEILGKYKWQVPLQLFGGAALIVGGLWFLMQVITFLNGS